MRSLLGKNDFVVFSELKDGKNGLLFEHNSTTVVTTASLTKVLYAAEIARMLHHGEIENESVHIDGSMLAGYGTDILSDLFSNSNKLVLDVVTLMKLMIKYSCNSSTLILSNRYLSDRRKLERCASKYWGMENVHLKYSIDKSKVENEMQLIDLLSLLRKIYLNDSEWLNIVRDSLKEAKSIYRLFDQQKINLIGSKSGTFFDEKGNYWIGDLGVFERKGKTFFISAVCKSRNKFEAVERIRSIGRMLLK